MFMSYFIELPNLDAAGLGKIWSGLGRPLWGQTFVHAASGETSSARSVLGELQRMSESSFVAPMFLAEVCFALGDVDTALAHAESFLRMHGSPVELLVGPRFSKLRADARFDEMLARVGFPPRPRFGEPAPFARTAVL